MQDLKEIFKGIKKRYFIESETDIKITSGVMARLSGKGTNPMDKKTEPTLDERKKIKDGLLNYGKKIIAFAKKM